MISLVATPFYMPLVGFVVLFTFSYMNIMPLTYKLTLTLLIYFFTILLPTLLIRLYRKYQGWSSSELAQKERRMVPYVIAILCYFACNYLLNVMRIPKFMTNLLMAAVMIQVLCAIINIWWKISTHSAAIGGFEGALMAFSFLFSFNPLVWFSIILILAGMVGTSRMILRQHSLSQVVAGFLTGFVCGFWVVL